MEAQRTIWYEVGRQKHKLATQSANKKKRKKVGGDTDGEEGKVRQILLI